jgi:signal transduction histidine kinase
MKPLRTLSARFMSISAASNFDPAPRRRRRRAVSLQGKVILTLLLLVWMAVGCSCWLFADESGQELTQVMNEQARLVAYTLSLASAPVLAAGNQRELERIGHDLLNTRNILYVAFYDAHHRPVALAHRYADFGWHDVPKLDPATASDLTAGTQVGALTDGQFGQHVDVCTRVVHLDATGNAVDRAANATATAGYLVVGVSLDREQAQLRRVNYLVVGVGVAAMLLSLPGAYLVVYGIFAPIRQLVAASQQIAAGQLDIRIDIDRSDLIGELARSFETMVGHVRQHRENLAAANTKLADANAQLASANRALEDANRDLEQKVQQRTAQLQTANDRLSREIAEKEDFLRAVSHDLNAPLRNIAGMAQVLLTKHRSRLDPDAVHRLERIQKNVTAETDLINELLELSRIKTRRQKMERVDTQAMVNDLAGVFEEDLRSRGITLTVQTPMAPLQAERARIRQVFQNLIDNAIKYMGSAATAADEPSAAPTKREIRVGCQMRADEVEFFVADTGIGIPAEDVGRIFYIFRRGRGLAQQVPGKGVGLASVKSIIETYSGTIWVESEPARGSTFRFTINGKYLADRETSAAATPPTEGAAAPATTDPPAAEAPADPARQAA